MRLRLPTSRKRVEDSVELRAWVLAAVLVGEIAVLTSGYFGAATGIFVPLLTVVAPNGDGAGAVVTNSRYVQVRLAGGTCG